MNIKKKFQDLNLCDNFLFAATMQDPETCKEVLELILKIRIEKVIVATEKTMVFNPDRRGIRMDVYAADEAQTVYNVEMQTTKEGNLPKRSRYYQSQIDVGKLKPGEDYLTLPKSFVIFICTFDPFGYGRCFYTIEERCLEEDFPLGDETRKIFLNTRGSDNESVEKELIYFLKYLEESTSQMAEAADNTFIRRLHNRVVEIKHDRETEERYMLFEEMLAKEKAAGIEQGIKQGVELGEQRTKKLIAAMSLDGRAQEIIRLTEDQAFYNEMLEKYQI